MLGGLYGAGEQGQCFLVGDLTTFRRSEENKRSESYGMRLRGAQEKAARRGSKRQKKAEKHSSKQSLLNQVGHLHLHRAFNTEVFYLCQTS